MHKPTGKEALYKTSQFLIPVHKMGLNANFFLQILFSGLTFMVTQEMVSS